MFDGGFDPKALCGGTSTLQVYDGRRELTSTEICHSWYSNGRESSVDQALQLLSGLRISKESKSKSQRMDVVGIFVSPERNFDTKCMNPLAEILNLELHSPEIIGFPEGSIAIPIQVEICKRSLAPLYSPN
ncbi:15726_t:CDS:2 [Acaulospora colombiana]|uniref:15726_t:CDS:1 n=1 Tax=Acaulospora colombiana TaxID=27376 RepID=A0ACA9PZE1_9GLOM|nr:15726_t:CDS:2 [Acaulospora colombiana]